MLLAMSSVWKLGSRAAGNISVYREKSDKQIFSVWFWNTVILPHTTIIPYQDFLHGHILFHLDNPDPVEKKTISNPNPKKSKYPAGLDSKSGSCTPLVSKSEVIGVIFLTPAPVIKKVTPAPAPEIYTPTPVYTPKAWKQSLFCHMR